MGADLLQIGNSGLAASKKSLETTGHNISNANTEGYSRQRVKLRTSTPIADGKIVHGTGVRVSHIERSHDQLVEKELNNSISDNSYNQEKSILLTRVEDIFNEINNGGLNKTFNKFFNSYRELANQPENETIRSIVREEAKNLVGDFHRIRKVLDNLSMHTGVKLEGHIHEINNTTRKISVLNKKITTLEAGGGETGDLRDERDLLVRTLSDYFDIGVFSDNRGRYVVNVKGVGTLVAGGTVQKLMAKRVEVKKSSNDTAGSMEVFFQRKDSSAVSTQIKKGQIGALFDVRNKHVKKLQDSLDRIAYNFANMVNAIHRRGVVNKNVELDANGNPLRRNKAVTNINLFKTPSGIKGASKTIELDKRVLDDLNNMATGLLFNRPGDNRVAIAISKLQHEKILHEGTTSLQEEYLKSIGQIGLEARKVNLDAEQSEGLLAQVKSMKERISGVSLDEETANMVRYQHAYQAAARVMKTADEMFRTVLNMKA